MSRMIDEELDSAAVRCAAAGIALERVEQHPDQETAEQLQPELSQLRERLRLITGDIADLYTVAHAFQVRRSKGKTA